MLQGWIERWAPGRDSGQGADTVSRALGALDQVHARPGRDRHAAEALLAADALFTSAVQDAAHSPDPERVMTTLLEAVAGMAESEREGSE